MSAAEVNPVSSIAPEFSEELSKFDLQWSDFDPEGVVLQTLKALVCRIEEQLFGEVVGSLEDHNLPIPQHPIPNYTWTPDVVLWLHRFLRNMEPLESRLRDRPVFGLHLLLLWYFQTSEVLSKSKTANLAVLDKSLIL